MLQEIILHPELPCVVRASRSRTVGRERRAAQQRRGAHAAQRAGRGCVGGTAPAALARARAGGLGRSAAPGALLI